MNASFRSEDDLQLLLMVVEGSRYESASFSVAARAYSYRWKSVEPDGVGWPAMANAHTAHSYHAYEAEVGIGRQHVHPYKKHVILRP